MRPPPIGVAVLGFFALVNGLGGLIIGLRLMGFVGFGPGVTGSGVFFWGALAFILGVLVTRRAWGAWTLRVWAWTFGMLVAILGIFNAVMVLIATGDLATGLGVALLPAVILWYLNTEGVKEAFIEGEIEAGRGFANDYERDVAERMAAERADEQPASDDRPVWPGSRPVSVRDRTARLPGRGTEAVATSTASAITVATRCSSSSVMTNGGPSRIVSPSTPSALPVPM